MADRLDVAVVGAGPFGLSVAAHLARLRVRAFGEPMQTWRTRMPPDMRLRFDWDETSLSAPGDRGSIGVWARAVGEPRKEPIPLPKFLRYADWFRETFVREVDPSDVAHVDRSAAMFRVTTAAGGEADARCVVVAVGVTPFPYAPPPFDGAMGDGIGYAIDRQDYSAYRGGRGGRRGRRPGRPRGCGARSPRRGGGRADRPLAAALVHRSRAPPARNPAPAARLYEGAVAACSD
jgi:FAD-dependent urate hydroxylase